MRLIKRIINIIQDPKRDFEERLFLLLPILTEMAMLLVFIGDIYIGEHILEIATLGVALILDPVIVYICLKWHKVQIGSKIVSVLVVFIIMPIVFFFGGGPDGGGILWITYSAIFVGLLVKGRLRMVVLTALFVCAVIDYALAWYFPQLVFGHDREMYYIDSLLSVIAVGIFSYSMVRFQIGLYWTENERVKKESRRAERLNASQNAFFANMSHEIRTPINTILGLNEMILREDVSDEVREDAENIQASGRLLLTLINDILDLSKLESGQMKLVSGEYQTGSMIKEIASMLAPKAKEKGLEFAVNVSPDVPAALFGDEIRIRQILINVLNNAIKYTDKGRISFSVRAEEGEEDCVSLFFTVSDTGGGIKKEDMPYLFSAFKRVDENRVHHIEGTGLGLSIVKQLTDIMGGRITVDSVYTKGSTFVIEIPQRIADKSGIGTDISDLKTHNTSRAGYRSRFEAPKARVLIVDDNETNLLVERKLLRNTKMLIDEAKSGKEALAKTLETSYQIILMDHLMPEMDGIECEKEIRMQKGGLNKAAKIVALTANAGGDHKKLFEEAGFDGYLTKPVSGEALENEAYRLLPKELITMDGGEGDVLSDTVKWMHAHERKKPVMITTESVADLPEELTEQYGIEVISHKVLTAEGCFLDGKEIDARGLHTYMRSENSSVETKPPTTAEYEEFFAEMLTKAEFIVHIALSNGVKHSSFPTAMEAASSFDNVFVFDSGHLSSGQGLLAVEAAKLALEGCSPKEIQQRLRKLIPKIHMEFIVDNLEYLTRSGEVKPFVGRFLNSLMTHPVMTLKKGRMRLSGIYFGAREVSWETFLSHEVGKMKHADKGALFITYTGMEQEELRRIREMVTAKAGFERVYMVQASPSISANCGPKTFGIVYRGR